MSQARSRPPKQRKTTNTMSDTNGSSPNGNGSGETATEVQFLLQQLYIKDLSFEAPHAPGLVGAQGDGPDIQLNLKNSHKRLDEHHHEVVLHLNIHAKIDDQTMFLVELDQAGLFYVQGYAEEETRRLLGIYCPNTLFPYARETVSSIVSKGGFPPLVLQPINFDALYEQAAQQAADSA